MLVTKKVVRTDIKRQRCYGTVRVCRKAQENNVLLSLAENVKLSGLYLHTKHSLFIGVGMQHTRRTLHLILPLPPVIPLRLM